MDDEPTWPDEDDDFRPGERMLLDDLRWCVARLDVLPDSPEVREMRQEVASVLSSWTNRPLTYSNSSPVTVSIPPERYLYSPPHRRTTPEGPETL